MGYALTQPLDPLKIAQEQGVFWRLWRSFSEVSSRTKASWT